MNRFKAFYLHATSSLAVEATGYKTLRWFLEKPNQTKSVYLTQIVEEIWYKPWYNYSGNGKQQDTSPDKTLRQFLKSYNYLPIYSSCFLRAVKRSTIGLLGQSRWNIGLLRDTALIWQDFFQVVPIVDLWGWTGISLRNVVLKVDQSKCSAEHARM